ncbi:MAG: long-chain-fatty-acid--CoA ligase [Burkholderiales bacterium]|nr:MAG: long-chain-fatty-acid--CoA ligase [Burkholderiales bacterium]
MNAIQERFWLASYPAAVPADIDWTRYGSLVHLIEEAFRRYARRPAYECMERTLSFRAVDELSRNFGAWLQSRGLQPCALVDIMMPNLLQYPVAIAGILRAGYVVVNVNPLYTARELEHQLRDSGAEAIVVLENFAATLAEVVGNTQVRHVVVTSVGDLLGPVRGRVIDFAVRHLKKSVPEFELQNAMRFGEVLDQGMRLQLRPVEIRGDDVAFLQYTGGTTGVSKGATLLHRNVVANVLQSEAWMQPALANPAKGAVGEDDQLVSACALPLYHIFALTVCCLLGMRTGGLVVLIPNPRDIPATVRAIGRHRINMFPAVNTLYNALLQDDDFRRLDFSGLRVSNGGGMAVQKAVADEWLRVTGCPICEGYGLSETSPSATCNPTDTDAFSGTIGLPMPSTDIVIRDDDGNDLPPGATGEICIRGPQVMAGYWNRPQETANVMYPDGFLKTGDIGIIDERGYIRIVDRKKDMILVSGFNVYPNEIEGVVAHHPGVLECAAIGVPDARSGEAVKLFVVKKDPHLTDRDIIEFCREQLTGYKKPKYIEFRTELPKSNVGKILRRELRDEALKKAA